VDYGARATKTPGSSDHAEEAPSRVTGFLDGLATWTVPHSYFIHFYIVAVLSSIVWATQLLSRGPLFRAIAVRTSEEHLQKSMSLNQVILCWLLMTIQGSRRLYECMTMAKPSASKMWFVHWLLGIAYYIAITLAMWIEGIGTKG
jgi:3-oxo-5-alpha-steroid 4-dehydrogenase 3